MNESKESNIGAVEWMDLTVEDAEQVQDFYSQVVGWDSAPVSMGEYNDFNINKPGSGETVAGICHARGSSSNLPAQWLIYVRVASVEQSATACEKLGGKVLDGPRTMGGNQFCVVQDTAGAVLALFSDE